MSDLSSLIARLEKAEGPSYSLEVEIAYLTGFWPAERIDRVTWADDGHVAVWFTEGPDLPLPPAVLSSFDAAVSLAERVLPGFGISIDTHPVYGDWWDASIFNRMPMTISNARKQKGPLALCLAILRALQQKGGTE